MTCFYARLRIIFLLNNVITKMILILVSTCSLMWPKCPSTSQLQSTCWIWCQRQHSSTALNTIIQCLLVQTDQIIVGLIGISLERASVFSHEAKSGSRTRQSGQVTWDSRPPLSMHAHSTTTLRSETVLVSVSTKQAVLMKLTVPWGDCSDEGLRESLLRAGD